jgi:hypothetical protein
MKTFSPALVTLAALGNVASADEWTCNGVWGDGGLRRYSWLFKGYCEDRSGQCFLDRIRGRGMTAHNWQCWRRDDGWFQADVSTTAGLAWQLNAAIEDVTHSWKGCWPNTRLATEPDAHNDTANATAADTPSGEVEGNADETKAEVCNGITVLNKTCMF